VAAAHCFGCRIVVFTDWTQPNSLPSINGNNTNNHIHEFVLAYIGNNHYEYTEQVILFQSFLGKPN
jgi:hypothetical protein